MKKSAYVHLALISAALASCNRPLYQQTATDDTSLTSPVGQGPMGTPDPMLRPYPGPVITDQSYCPVPDRTWDTLSSMPRGDSAWYRAFRETDLNFQLYAGNRSYPRGRWSKMSLTTILRSGFGRSSFHAGA